jgi:hypothetical protein
MAIRINDPNAQISTLVCINRKNIEININEKIVNINKITKKKKSSTGPTSFSLSFNIKNLDIRLL